MFLLLTIGCITVHSKRSDEQWARKYQITGNAAKNATPTKKKICL